MNKQELVAYVAQKAGITKKDAGEAIDTFLTAVRDSLRKKDPVRLIGFGTFSVRRRAARKGRNPRTRAPINIPARYAPVWKASSQLRKLVNK